MNNFFEIYELLEKINKYNNVVICRNSLDTTKSMIDELDEIKDEIMTQIS